MRRKNSASELSAKAEDGRRASQAESAAKDLPVLSFATARAWSEWLASHHASSRGAWLKIAKKGAGSASVTYSEALDGALAWGWIDGQKGKFDDVWWLQRFTPRTAKSAWSKINRAKAEALIAAGTMTAPGLVEVERAKRDGRWDRAYDGARSSSAPADLAAAFARNARARAFFETLDAANRYAILYRVQTAKRPETRAERIARFVTMCARHETIHPQRRAKSASRGASKKARTRGWSQAWSPVQGSAASTCASVCAGARTADTDTTGIVSSAGASCMRSTAGLPAAAAETPRQHHDAEARCDPLGRYAEMDS